MFVERSNNGWAAHAPAKINLALEILGRQSDGYHQVETLLVPVRLFDTLVYLPTQRPLQFVAQPTRSYPAFDATPASNDNLVVRAVRKLAQAAGCEATGRWVLHKRIPMQAGLGGGSSDAAAALVLANRAWRLGYSTKQLSQLAAELGTDVPFFLERGAAIGTGRGEQISRVSLPAGLPIVIVQPTAGLSTPRVFAQLRLEPGAHHKPATSRCRKLVEFLQQGSPVRCWKHLIHNCLQPAAAELSNWVAELADTMSRLPVLAHQMTGSGSAFFAVCRTDREARSVASQLRGQHWPFVFATQTGQY